MELESNVIDRLKEQLALAGCVRGAKKPIYKAGRGGKKTLSHYALQHITVVSADVLELCGLCCDQSDPIVEAQIKGHSFSVAAERGAGGGKATMYADDLFHLISLAETKPEFASEHG